MTRHLRTTALGLALGALAACLPAAPPADTTEAADAARATPGDAERVGSITPVADCQPDPARKRLLWGDLHVHTNQSFDAYFFNGLNGPREALRFAKGGPAWLPDDDPMVPGAEVRLDRPLHFTAVTDHSEFLGTFAGMCGVDGQPATNPVLCEALGRYIRANVEEFVGGENPLSDVQEQLGQMVDSSGPWAALRTIVEEETPSDCSFSALLGYEFSAQPSGSMMHRNIVFRSLVAPNAPVSSNEADDEWQLFSLLDQQCIPGAGCRYLSIPHNSNMSDGRMFPELEGGLPPAPTPSGVLTPELAHLKADRDRLFEMTQHKGQSECAPNLGGPLGSEEDEACAFEVIKPVCTGGPSDPPSCKPACTGGESDDPELCHAICQDYDRDTGESIPADCVAPRDYVRTAITQGLAIERTLGVNPYRFGFAGATDTHNGLPGAVEESSFRGHGGVLDDDPAERLGAWECDRPPCTAGNGHWAPAAWSLNPGGLTAVWAEVNRREAVFDALHRREAYATSGPRVEVRTFASRRVLPSDVCARLEAGEGQDAAGPDAVPMGGDLPSGGSPPSFAVFARMDAGGAEPGTPLQRLEIVKGWVDADGGLHTERHLVDGRSSGPAPSASCEVPRLGQADHLCGVWTDPDFDPALPASYYVRVLENESCRWSTRQCVDRGVDCGQLSRLTGTFPESSGLSGWEGCCTITRGTRGFVGTARFDTIQERAWTSPIVYTPAP